MRTAKRTTKLKTQIISLLEKHHLLTATELLAYLHAAGLKVNKTSVYRNLESFLEEGLICQQVFGDGGFSYELQREHHDHVSCTACGKVSEIPCQYAPNNSVEGYTVNHHHLTLYGTCAECQL